MKDILDAAFAKGVPLGLSVTLLVLLAVVWMLDKVAGVAARVSGSIHDRQAGIVSALEAQLVRSMREAEHERERAESATRSRDAADQRLAVLHGQIETMHNEISRLTRAVGTTTSEFPAVQALIDSVPPGTGDRTL